MLFHTLQNIVFPFHFTWSFPGAGSNCHANYSTSSSFLGMRYRPPCASVLQYQPVAPRDGLMSGMPDVHDVFGTLRWFHHRRAPQIAKRSHRMSSNAKVVLWKLKLRKLPAFVVCCSFFATAMKIATPNPNISRPNISKDFQIYPN